MLTKKPIPMLLAAAIYIVRFSLYALTYGAGALVLPLNMLPKVSL